MLSIITPTMWRYQPYCDFIANVVQLPTVGEIIIINNDNEKTPDHPVLKHDKVRIFDFGQNILVNPAWNFGAKTAKFDKLCFLSDDVIVDLKLFLEIDNIISADLGPFAVGSSPEIYHLQSSNATRPIENPSQLINTGIITYNKYGSAAHIAGLGALFFTHKSNWVDIPEELQIHYGEGWIFDTQHMMGKPVNFINNVFFYSPWGVTVRAGNFKRNLPDLHEKENNEKYKQYKARWVRTTNYPIPEYLENY